MPKDSETSVVTYINPFPYYWITGVLTLMMGRRGRTTTKTYMYNTFVHCFVIILDPCSKSRVLMTTVIFSCVVGPPHFIILVSIPAIAWNLLKHIIEFPNKIIIQSHLPHVREGFSLFWRTFRGRIPVCPP